MYHVILRTRRLHRPRVLTFGVDLLALTKSIHNHQTITRFHNLSSCVTRMYVHAHADQMFETSTEMRKMSELDIYRFPSGEHFS